MRNRMRYSKASLAAGRKSRVQRKAWQEEGRWKSSAQVFLPFLRCTALPTAMALGAAGLVSILVVAGALEFSEKSNPIIVAANVATCLMFVAIFACARLASNQSIRRMVTCLDDGSIEVRAAIGVIVVAYAIMVFWAGPGYVGNCIPSTDYHLKDLSDCGESMFVPVPYHPVHK